MTGQADSDIPKTPDSDLRTIAKRGSTPKPLPKGY